MSQGLLQNFCGGSRVSDARVLNLSESINLYQETTGEGSSSSVVLRSCPGTSSLFSVTDIVSTATSVKCRGMFQASRDVLGLPSVFSVFGPRLFWTHTLEDGSIKTDLVYDSLSETLECVSMTETGGYGSAHPHLVIVDGVSCYAVQTDLSLEEMKSDFRSIQLPYRVNKGPIYDEDNDAWVDQDDMEFIAPSHCAYLYGYLIVNDSQTDAFYCSIQYPFETLKWIPDSDADNGYSQSTDPDDIDYDIFGFDSHNPTYEDMKYYGYITYSEWSPDATIALIDTGTKLYTFGTRSTQTFSYSSDYQCPFTSGTWQAQGIGLLSRWSPAKLGSSVFFLGTSDSGVGGVFSVSGTSVTRLSTPDIERRIIGLTHPEDSIGCAWIEDGHSFYSINFWRDDLTLVYDALEKSWHRRATRSLTSDELHCWRITHSATWNQTQLYGTTDGHLIQLDRSKSTEYDGRTQLRLRRSGMLYSSYQPFYLDNIRLILSSGQNQLTENPRIQYRVSDFGGDWTDARTMLTGQTGQFNWVSEAFNLGVYTIACLEVWTVEDFSPVFLGVKIAHQSCDWF